MRLNKKFSKKGKNINRLCSVNTLYVVFIVFLVNFFQFLYRKDYESIFLFIVVAVSVHLFNKNMIYVLLIPLIFVNLLIFLRFVFGKNNLEGFKNSMGEDMVPEYSKIHKQLVQFWISKNLKEGGDEDDKYGYEYFDFKLKDENDNEYEKTLSEIIRNIKATPIPDDINNYDTTAVEDLENYVSQVMQDGANPTWKDTNSAGRSSEKIAEKDRNEKTFNFINNKIMKGLKEDMKEMIVAINDESNRDSEDDSEKDDSEKDDSEKDDSEKNDSDNESSNNNSGSDNSGSDNSNNNETSDNETSNNNVNLGMSNFKSYDKNQDSIQELSKGTQDLLKELDVMNPVMEKSMKMLEDIDIDKMEKLMEKFGKFGNMFNKK